MLPGDTLMVHQDDVARREAGTSEALDPIFDHDAEIGHEVRDAADVLRDQPSVHVEQRAAIIADLVDHHVIRGALQIDGHLVGDRRQRVAQHFERNGVEARRLFG